MGIWIIKERLNLVSKNVLHNNREWSVNSVCKNKLHLWVIFHWETFPVMQNKHSVCLCLCVFYIRKHIPCSIPCKRRHAISVFYIRKHMSCSIPCKRRLAISVFYIRKHIPCNRRQTLSFWIIWPSNIWALSVTWSRLFQTHVVRTKSIKKLI